MFVPDDPGDGEGWGGGVGFPVFWPHDVPAISRAKQHAMPYRTAHLFIDHPDRKESSASSIRPKPKILNLPPGQIWRNSRMRPAL